MRRVQLRSSRTALRGAAEHKCTADNLCVRDGLGVAVSVVGLSFLVPGLVLTAVEIERSANKKANDACASEWKMGNPCATQTQPHDLYGDVDGRAYVRSGAATARVTSDGLLYVGSGMGGLLTLLWGRRYAAAYGASVGITWLTTDIIKLAASTPRPINWLNPEGVADATQREDVVDEQSSVDAQRSMPSGHTSITAAATFSIATLLFYDFKESATRTKDSSSMWICLAACYGTAAAITTTVGALRVLGGKHHIEDVLVGASIGTALGVIVPFVVLKPASGPADEAGIHDVTFGYADGQGIVGGRW